MALSAEHISIELLRHIFGRLLISSLRLLIFKQAILGLFGFPFLSFIRPYNSDGLFPDRSLISLSLYALSRVLFELLLDVRIHKIIIIYNILTLAITKF